MDRHTKEQFSFPDLEDLDGLFVFPGPLPEFNVRAAFEKQQELGRALTKEEFDQLPRAVYTKLEV